jgi:Fic family protein
MKRLAPTLTGPQILELTRLLGEIDFFRGHWRKLQEIRAEKLAQLRQVTTIESAASSTRIEGVELSDAEVARVLQGVSVESFRARDESEVRGYGDLLQTIFDDHAGIAFDENHIKHLHKILLRYSERDERHRGEYKKQENHVEARHPDGRIEVIFRTASPFDTPRLMAEQVALTRAALSSGEVHPLIVIARFIVEFLAIHPFKDGNGRLSRALTTLLLLQSGYDYVPYSSLERVVEENKAAYYAALRASQSAMRSDPNAFGDWLLFLLRALHAQKRNLEAKLEVEQSMLQLSGVQQQLLELVERSGRVTTSVLAAELRMPVRTVRYHLDVLLRQRLVEARGEKRGRYYTRALGSSPAPIERPASPTAAILAEILERGGRIGRSDLIRLVRRFGYDPRTIGTMHGRRLAHLRRDAKTRESVLTSRGQEIAEQHIFTERLSRGGRPVEADANRNTEHEEAVTARGTGRRRG